jgi:hypothetical protein
MKCVLTCNVTQCRHEGTPSMVQPSAPTCVLEINAKHVGAVKSHDKRCGHDTHGVHTGYTAE